MPRGKHVTTAIYCNRYKPNKDGVCPISIKVTFNRVKRFYDTGVAMSAQDFDALYSPRIKPDQKKRLMAFNAEEQRAKDCIDGLSTGFTFERFEKLYLSNAGLSDSLYDRFDAYTSKMDADEQFSTIENYQTARNCFNKFKPGISIGDVSVSYLNEFEKWYLKGGGSITTVGIYMRALRAVYNMAIEDGRVSRELYPFGMGKKGKYEIPTGRNPKKALPTSAISSLFHYQCPDGSPRHRAKDYWIFMYLGNGINMKDMLLLKWENLTPEGIKFTREKTKRTKKERETITIVSSPELMKIIRVWGNTNKAKDQYIFPHIEQGSTAEEIRKRVKQITKIVNQNMRLITKDLKIGRAILTNDARHSYATVMKNSGAPLTLISEALGHGSFKTTQNYLDSFENDQLRKASSALTAVFKQSEIG